MVADRKSKKEPLRQRAEELLSSKSPSVSKMGDKDLKNLVHELQVHQVELEMQNEELRKAQEEIEESRLKYSDLYDFAPIGYFTFSPTGDILEVNLTGASLLGIEREKLIRRPFTVFVDAEFRSHFLDHCRSILSSKNTERCDLKLTNKDGRSFYASLQSILSRDGNILSIRSAVSDITELKKAQTEVQQLNARLEDRIRQRTAELETSNQGLRREVRERKRAEEALRESEERFRTLADATFEGIGISEHGRIVDANERLAQIIGSTRAELIGQEVAQFVVPEDRDRVMADILNGVESHTEHRMFRRDGTPIIVETYGRTIPYKGRQARITAIRDITERKRMEEALQKSEERYRTLFDTAPDAIVVHRDGRFLDANEETLRLIGAGTFEDLASHGVLDLFGAEDREQAAERMRLVTIESRLPTREATLLRLDGREVAVEFHTAQTDFQGAPAIQTIIRDITERKRVEEILREQHERVTWLARLPEQNPNPVLRATADGSVLYCNPASATLQGWKCEVGQVLTKELFSLVGRTIAERREIQADIELDGRIYLVWVVPFPQEGYVNIYSRDITVRKKAEDALRENQALLSAIMENTPDPVYVKDRQSRIVMANPALAKVVGKPLEEILGRTVSEYYGDLGTGQALREHDLRVMESGQSEVTEETVPTPRGYRTFLSSKTPYRNASGDIIGITGISRDITERKRMEEALRESEERFRAFMDNSPTIAWAKDEQGCYVYLSRTYEERFGVRWEDWRGKTDFQLWPPDIAEGFRKVDQAVLATGQMTEVEVQTRNADGSYCIWWNFKFPFRDALDRRYVGGVGMDITERKRVEEALLASRNQLQNIIDNTDNLVYVFDLEERVLIANRAVAELLNSSPERLIGKKRNEFMAEETAAWHEANDRKVIAAGSGLEFEEYGEFKGRAATFLTNKFPLRDRQGRIYAVGGVTVDITDRKRTEEALKQRTVELQRLTEALEERVNERTLELASTNKALVESENRLQFLSARLLEAQEEERKRLAAEVHDGFSSSLSAIKYRLDVMQTGNNATAEDLDRLKAQVQGLIEESRRIQMALRPSILDDFGIISALGWFTREFQKTYSHMGVIKEIDVEEREIPNQVKTPIFRICQEAFHNVAKHSQAKSIRLSLRTRGSSLELEIHDDGVGIRSEILESGKDRGRGLGLVSMEERASLSGGVFTIHSEIGKGTTIRVSWPLR